MTNLILRQGDYVKCIISTQFCDEGSVYQIETDLDQSLVVRSIKGHTLSLVDHQGELTDYSDFFAVIPMSQVLPRGLVS